MYDVVRLIVHTNPCLFLLKVYPIQSEINNLKPDRQIFLDELSHSLFFLNIINIIYIVSFYYYKLVCMKYIHVCTCYNICTSLHVCMYVSC